MPVTSGVHAIRGVLRVDGTDIVPEKIEVTLPAERKSATWSAEIAIDALPEEMGEDYWATSNPTKVECVVSVDGAETVLLTGTVDTLEAPLAETRISLKGRCLSAKLHEKKAREKWQNKKPEEVIKDLAGRVGLAADVADFGLKAGTFVQIDWAELAHGHSYSQIIDKLCAVVGARWWVDGATLKVKIDPESDVYEVEYLRGVPDRSDARRVSVTRNFQAARPAKVKTHGWDSRQKKAVHADSNVSGVGDVVEYTYEHHGVSAEKAEKHSKAKAKEHARHEFSGHVDLVGDVTVNRAKKLRLTGNAYAGDYDVETVSHSVGQHGGFTTTISFKGPKKGRTVS